MISQSQAPNRNFFDNFGSRIAFIRRKRDLSLAALADGSASTAKSWENGSLPRPPEWEAIAGRLRLSVSFVFAGEPRSDEDYEFIASHHRELVVPASVIARWPAHLTPAVNTYPKEDGPTAAKVGESPPAYEQPSVARGAGAAPASGRVELNPAHAPRPAEPTEQDCIDYFLRYLGQARRMPGGIGHTWIELQRRFPLDEKPDRKSP